ncbi:MAG: hypothetical protein K2Q26_15040 [Bdellovibrionales bacterium]|nr:hypothetical protein [Bdellovibrionales bacterium]
METYKPAPTPRLKMILTNWMVHLAVLISVIVGLVLYDRDKPRSTQTSVSQAAYKRNVKQAAPKEIEAAPTEESVVAAAVPKEIKPAPFRKSLNPETLSNEPEDPPAPKVAAAAPTLLNVQGMNVTFYHASRNPLIEIQRDARPINIGGDGTGGIVLKKLLDGLQENGGLKNVAKNSYRDFQVGQSIVIFKGQRSIVSSKNIGLNFQITPLKKEGTSATLEVKAWSNIQDPTKDDELFTSEMTLNTQSVGFIAGFLPKDRPINDEEKSLFETDRTLKIYNNPAFWDDAIDLIMFIEFTGKP